MDAAEFYPRELWTVSPVYSSYVKLFIKDVHALRPPPTEGLTFLTTASDDSRQTRSSTFLAQPPHSLGPSHRRHLLNHPEGECRLHNPYSSSRNELIEVDDGSGATIDLMVTEQEHRGMMPDYEYDEKQEKLWKRKRKPGRVAIGDTIKVKGELYEKWNLKIKVMKLDVVVDQNVEIKAWQDRVEFKKTLSKPWKLPTSVLAKHHKPTTGRKTTIGKENRLVKKEDTPAMQKKTAVIDFQKLPLAAHSIRNLKLLLLTEIAHLQRFKPSDLLSRPDIHYAATCVATHDNSHAITEREVQNTLVSACHLLVRDGNIILPRGEGFTEENMYIVVGKWNLGGTVRAVARREGRVVVREMWVKVLGWGRGWEGTTKGVVGAVVEDVLRDLEGEEWVETKAGQWTRIDE